MARSRPASAATAAAATAAEGDLNVAEGGFGAQQVLQSAVCSGSSASFQSWPFSLSDAGLHLRRGCFQILHEGLEFLIRSGQFAAAGALRQRLRLFLQLGLHFGQKLRVLRRVDFVFGVAANLVPGGRDDFLLALRNFVLLLVAATRRRRRRPLLRLRVVLLERLRFDEQHVGARSGARVLAPWRTW